MRVRDDSKYKKALVDLLAKRALRREDKLKRREEEREVEEVQFDLIEGEKE